MYTLQDLEKEFNFTYPELYKQLYADGTVFLCLLDHDLQLQKSIKGKINFPDFLKHKLDC
ncbi:hypothetical protein ACLBWQ_08825 [Chryseobacterium sp. M5A1_1a]